MVTCYVSVGLYGSYRICVIVERLRDGVLNLVVVNLNWSGYFWFVVVVGVALFQVVGLIYQGLYFFFELYFFNIFVIWFFYLQFEEDVVFILFESIREDNFCEVFSMGVMFQKFLVVVGWFINILVFRNRFGLERCVYRR